MQSEQDKIDAGLDLKGFIVLFLTGTFLLVQCLVPLLGLFIRRPTPFSWKMFAYGNGSVYDVADDYSYQVLFRDGHTENREEIRQKLGPYRTMRSDAEFRHVPAYICQRMPDAVEIRVEANDFAAPQSFLCP